MGDLSESAQEVQIVDETTGYVCRPNLDGSLPIAPKDIAGSRVNPATEDGNLLSIKGKTDNIPALGQAGMTGSVPVVIANNQSDVPVSHPGVQSVGNSTITPLLAGATFTGVWEDVSAYAYITETTATDQASAVNGHKIQWSSDEVNVDGEDAFTETAPVIQARPHTVRGKYFRKVYINGAVNQTYFRMHTTYHKVGSGLFLRPIDKILTNANQALTVRAVLTGQTPVGVYQNIFTTNTGNLKVAVQEGSDKPTYSASITSLPLVAAPTDIFTLTGSATKTIRVSRVAITGYASTSIMQDVLLIKRSTTNTGGTSTSPPCVCHDPSNAAATAVCRAYTANPTTLGNIVGTIFSRVATFYKTNAAAAADPDFYGADRPSQAIILRGTGDVLALNLAGLSVGGGLANCSIEWTEEG